MPRLTRRPLLAAPDLELFRVRCDGVDAPHPAEESVGESQVVVPLVGRFVYRDRDGHAVASPTMPLYLVGGERFEIAHPHGEGDLSLALCGELARRLVEAGPVTRPLSAGGYLRLHHALALVAPGGDAEQDRLALEEELGLALAPEAADGELRSDRRSGPLDRRGRRDRERAATIAHQVELRFDEPLPLGELAALAGVSLFEACRIFRRARGSSIHEYRRSLRLRHALALLLESKMPLAELALAVGFANQGHFGNAFREEYGVAPGQVRKPGGLAALRAARGLGHSTTALQTASRASPSKSSAKTARRR